MERDVWGFDLVGKGLQGTKISNAAEGKGALENWQSSACTSSQTPPHLDALASGLCLPVCVIGHQCPGLVIDRFLKNLHDTCFKNYRLNEVKRFPCGRTSQSPENVERNCESQKEGCSLSECGIPLVPHRAVCQMGISGNTSSGRMTSR